MSAEKETSVAVGLVVVVGDGALHLGGSGQGLEALYADPIVKANKPSGGYKKHGFDTMHLSRYEDTDFVQWQGRRASGYFYPWGPLMRITDAGKRAIAPTPASQERATPSPYPNGDELK